MDKTVLEQLKEGKQLLDEGVITEEEFQQLKAKILSSEPQKEEKAEEPKPEIKKEEKTASHISCTNCGSTDLSKIDEYTYKCNSCGSTVTLKRPDVQIHNYNAFAANVDDIPIYKYKKTLSERKFVRDCILDLAKNGNVSPMVLGDLEADESMVKLAYITYARVEYSVDVSYSCMIGKDYKVTYHDSEGHEKTKTETKWESFSGSGSDGGNVLVDCFGNETNVKFSTPRFSDSWGDEQVPYSPENKYPLKKNIDNSSIESLKRSEISALEYHLKSHVPGDHMRDWHASGKCSVSKPNSFYYVPAFNLEAKSGDHGTVELYRTATKSGSLTTILSDSTRRMNQVSGTKPTYSDGTNRLDTYGYGKFSKAFKIIFPIMLSIGIVLLIILAYCDRHPVGLGLLGMSSAASLVCLLVNRKMRSNTISDVTHNLIVDFENAKLGAASKALAHNNLEDLTEEETKAISNSKKLAIDYKKKFKITLGYTIPILLLFVGSIVLAIILKK